MATMVKEKRREKKKAKERREVKSSLEEEQPSVSRDVTAEESVFNPKGIEDKVENLPSSLKDTASTEIIINCDKEQLSVRPVTSMSHSREHLVTEDEMKCKQISNTQSDNVIETVENKYFEEITPDIIDNKLIDVSNIDDTCEDLSAKLERMAVPKLYPDLAEAEILQFESDKLDFTYVNKEAILIHEDVIEGFERVENAVPSAPIFEEEMPQPNYPQEVIATKEVVPKIKCMPLEEAVNLFGGTEMAEVRAMSDKEEAIVEEGPISGPEHPLVDLLTTFRSSLIAVERERTQLTIGFINEEKYRSQLWKVQKQTRYATEQCPCGLKVSVTAVFEVAELMSDRLPVAKMKLEGLLRDVQESYCHHQHAALLAHCQIEEIISETIQSNKKEIREALALVLQALRLSDGAAALTAALQRWACALTAALLGGQDRRQLLYLMHQLFRQTRSVRWAARLIHITVGDRVGAAQAIALLDLLLAKPRLESAQECTEDTEEMWEEMDRHGTGAVSEGALRERDLLAILRAFPLRDLVARLVLFTHSDISQAREPDWGATDGGGVLRACCGVRALLATLQRAAAARAHYTRLRAALRHVAASALRALAAMHTQCSDSYTKEQSLRLTAELEASFSAGFILFGAHALDKLPATLLDDDTAKDYCTAFIVGLHDTLSKPLVSLSLSLPVLSCGERVRIVTQAAIDRAHDNELARVVLDFLLQTGIKRNTTACKGSCDSTARESLAPFLAAHPYLHTVALHMLADLSQMEPVSPSCVAALCPEAWRPSMGEARAVLGDWAQRARHLLPSLLLSIDCTPHTGIALEAQLAVGSWLCHWLPPAPPPEWAWCALRRLRVHRTSWLEPLDAPPPELEPSEPFAMAFAVLSSAWGHSIPLICSHGVTALCKVAAVRARDAVHCLGPVMLVMAHSPESVSLTPKFHELMVSLLCSGPTLVQRALGTGPAAGSHLILNLMLQQLEGNRYTGLSRLALLSAWLHALWSPALAAAALLDTVLLACREWTHFDSHAALLLQKEDYKEHIAHSVRNVAQAPLLCESVLRSAHAQLEARTQLWARLLDVLHLQRVAGDRIHVDNALKHIGSPLVADELVIYRVATAVLSAPAQHPAHLTLWRLFFHLYLQRPPNNPHDSVPPVGPLFFSGLIKARTLGQLRKRLKDTISYHQNERAALKPPPDRTSPTQTSTRSSPTTEDKLFPELSVIDLTGESSESSDSESSSDGEPNDRTFEEIRNDVVTDEAKLIGYHTNAEKLLRECVRWLEEGDKVRAMPYHADIARNIPETCLDVAWSRELSRRRPPSTPDAEAPPLPPDTAPPAPPPPPTPFRTAITAILNIKDRSRRRIRSPTLKSPVKDLDYRDTRALLQLVDTHLSDIARLAAEWSSDVSRLSSLDGKLWECVRALRVSRPLPLVTRACANKCAPITFAIPIREWCISTAAERGIKENRAMSRAVIRRLARPRPHAARTAAALQAIASRTRECDSSARAAERAWQCAAAVTQCAPAHAALTAMVELLAERWLCQDGQVCAELLSRWAGSGGSSALQQSLCGALVSPRRLPPAHCQLLYSALLRARLPSHAVFSYLSKFEMSRWSASVEPAQRRELLEALLSAAQRWGNTPDTEHHVLLELIGVHTSSLLDAHEVCAHVSRCARASVQARLPPAHWTHVTAAVARVGSTVHFDQLGHLLRELGVCWWEARAGLQGRKGAPYSSYAPYIAMLLHALQRAFVAAGVTLTYAPEKIGRYAWSTLQESWAPWVSPHPALPPLLAATADRETYTPMLRRFGDNVHQVMLDCPGTEEYLLQQVFIWAIQTYLSVASGQSQETHRGRGESQESRVQLSALLSELGKLPWTEHHWMHPDCHQSLLQICGTSDKEITSWCNVALRGVSAEAWLRVVTQDHLAPTLATLLAILTGMTHAQQTLEEAGRLPWPRLPEAALDDALERFFAQYHNPALPYHDLPQFRLLLFASELLLPPGASPQQTCASPARSKRARAVAQWVRAASTPALAQHVHAHTNCVLTTITDLAPCLDSSEGETEELLSRAMVLMCLEPAAAAALPVWLKWVHSAPRRLTGACLAAAGALTAFEYFAPVADEAAKAHLAHKECLGWSEVCERFRASHWTDASPLAVRARLHAAYAVARTHPQPYEAVRTALLAMLAANINFVENEIIIAVWICYSCRVARECAGAGERGECAGAARGLLARWGDEPRRSILRVVTAQPATSATTRHRLLCRLAQCLVSPGESEVRAFEATCAALLGATSDVMPWGKQPHPRHLPRLAMRLYPGEEKYFKEELDLCPGD